MSAALSDARRSMLVVDLREVGFIDSSGLNALLELRKRAVREETRLVLVRGPEPVERVFEMTSLTRVFEMVDDPASIPPEVHR
jgi:anti-anti-sigma factor